MTEWTGVLYGFYSNKPVHDVFKLLKESALGTDYKFDCNKYQEEETMLFYKNDEMLNYHLENGYNTDLNAEGCFCIEAKKANLHGIASLFEFENSSDFEPYDINLIFNNISYYVLIVPDFIENSIFSAGVHGEFKNVLESVAPLAQEMSWINQKDANAGPMKS